MDFFHSHVSEQAKKNVLDVLESGYLSEGTWVKRFEQELEQKIGLRNVVAVNSGTSALHLALNTLRVQAGDEVITTPQTFIATALSILYTGATVVFADIDPTTGNISSESVESKITDKTIGILPVHYGGMPCDLDALNQIGEEYGLFVIDDACQALGATYKGKPIGSGTNEATCFSTQATKGLSTGDGGLICFQSDLHKFLAQQARWFGIDREHTTLSELGEREYLIHHIGFKYHMNNIDSAIGLGNLTTFKERLNKRRRIATRYSTELANVAGLELLDYEKDYNCLNHNDTESSFYLFILKVEKRLDFVRKLKERGIPTIRAHSRIDRHTLFSLNGIDRDLVGQTEFEEKQIAIPCHEGLTQEDVDKIIDVIKGGW